MLQLVRIWRHGRSVVGVIIFTPCHHFRQVIFIADTEGAKGGVVRICTISCIERDSPEDLSTDHQAQGFARGKEQVHVVCVVFCIIGRQITRLIRKMGSQLHTRRPETPRHGRIHIGGSHVCGIKFIHNPCRPVFLEHVIKRYRVVVYIGEHIPTQFFLEAQPGRIPLKGSPINACCKVVCCIVDAMGYIIEYRLGSTCRPYTFFHPGNK